MSVEWIRHQIGEIDQRLAHLSEGRQILEQLRDGYERLLQHTESPGQVPDPTGTGPEGSPAPAPEQPGSARSGQRERRRHGRRAPASSAAPSTSSSGSVGTPAPAPLQCPDCDHQPFAKPQGLGRHRSAFHPEAWSPARQEAPTSPVSPGPAPVRPLGADVARADRREIDELCTRGCGRRFRWEPSFLSHIRTCDGRPKAATGGGSSMKTPSESGLIGAAGA